MQNLKNQIPIYIKLTRSEDLDDNIKFYLANGKVVTIRHDQDCCEEVVIDDIVGNLDNLLYNPLLRVDKKVYHADTNYGESETWTFYTLATIKGYVDIKWHDSSNGYYSESVDSHIQDFTPQDLPSEVVDYLRRHKPELLI